MESIVKEIINILEYCKENTLRVSYILSKLDFSEFLSLESFSKFTLTSIFKLYIFRLIKGIRTYNDVIIYLNKHEQEAFELGFYKDDKDNLNLPPKRTYNHYLQTKITKEQIQQLDLVAENILSLATRRNILLDLEIVKNVIKKEKKNYKREIREATRLVKRLVYPKIDIKIKENGKFTTKDLLDVLVHVALTHDFTNNGSFTFEEMNQDKQSPSGDLMMYHFSKFKSVTQIRSMFENILGVIFNFAKREYNILQRRKLDIAYDVHEVPYYGKSGQYVCGGEHKNGTNNFFKFLTCSIVVSGKRFILDVIPIHQLDSIPDLLEESLIRVKNKIRIERAYLDRGFNSCKIINVLKKYNINFIMPQTKTSRVKAWFDKSEACESRVIKDFEIGTGKDKAIVNLILVDDEEGIKRAFISNIDIAPCIANRFCNLYSKRWGIETSYRNIEHDFKARTTTNNYLIRLFYFLFSCCLYNLWVLVNICISLIIYGRIKEKPIISAKMFCVILYNVQVGYFEEDG